MQGGLKLKISALKIPKKAAPPARVESSSSSSSSERDHSSSDEEADKSSDASRQASPVPVRKHNADSVRKYTQIPRTPEPEPPKPQKEESVVAKARESPLKDKEDKKHANKTQNPTPIEKKDTFVKPARTVSEERLVKTSVNSAKLVKEDPRSSARLANLNAKTEAKTVKTPTKVNNRTSNAKIIPKSVKAVTPVKSVEKLSPVVQSAANTSRLRNFRKKPRPRAETEKTPTKVGIIFNLACFYE